MNTIIRDNERSHAIDLISQINNITTKFSLQIKKAGGERTISTIVSSQAPVVQENSFEYANSKRKTMFPDVVLYGDNQKTRILQGWELKLPDTLITDETFIKDAQRKAVALGLNSCFIWNFTSGVLYIKNDNGSFDIAKQWTNTNHIKTRSDVELYRSDWEREIERIILEINDFFTNGELKGANLGEIISDTVVATLVSRNKELVADSIKSYATSNTIANAYIEQWWKEVEREYSKDETDKYNAYSKIVILNWTNRIVFAHLIKKYHNDARKVLDISDTTSVAEANDIFNEVTRTCDFYSIFSEVKYNTNIPQTTWFELVDLNGFLSENGIEEIEQASLQTILEGTVSTAKRELAGQYTTPSTLAELLAKITITNLNGNVIDPCCGTGSIPKETLNYKKSRISKELSVNTVWAADKYKYPLQIANISLTSPETINIPNKVFQQNALNLSERGNVEIVNPTDGTLMDIEIPKFDAVLSNLPFIPFEIIMDDDKRLINTTIEEINDNTGITLSLKSDIYCFLMFSLHKILNDDGRAGFIISNSWLGTVWGKEFYKALNHYYHVEQIHISGNGRWFDNAQVVTTIIVLNKKQTISAPDEQLSTLFYSWGKSLSEIKANNDIKQCIINSTLLKINNDNTVLKQGEYTYKNISHILDMNVSLNAFFHNIEWLSEITTCLIPINQVFNVIRGERRGWDDMFYPESGHGIEKTYIRRVLKNARNVTSLIAEPDNDAFCCSYSLTQLEANTSNGALRWIKKFENVVNGTGKPLPDVLAKRNMHWYEMKDTSTTEIFTMMNPDKRLFFAKFNEPTFINQRLIGLRKKVEYADIDLNHALLNSILGMFYIEAVGFGRGLGALDINKDSINNAFMLNPKMVSDDDRTRIIECFNPILEREIKSTQEELGQEDREIFDKAVFKAFGIEDYYERVKKSLISMQASRLSVR